MTDVVAALSPQGAGRAGKALGKDARWWLFCLGILAVKFVLLAADPAPKFFFGDSRSYLWTAISGWIPPDRSYFYGYLIRWLALSTHSLTILLIGQVIAGATIAITLCWICLEIFRLPFWLAAVFGLLSCLDPLQLYWEHAVMAETPSLLCYAVLLQRSFRYLARPNIVDLVLVQLLSILAIGFRVSYLILLIVLAVILPILAFKRGQAARLFYHMVVSVGLMLALHGTYLYVNGRLNHREPQYLYGTGFQLLSCWTPVLQPGDGADDKMSDLIARGSAYDFKNLRLRPAQRFDKLGLVEKLMKLEQDNIRADKIAKETALHALRRDPAGVARVTLGTYLLFWNPNVRRNLAKNDVGELKFTPEDEIRLRTYFHQDIPREQHRSWLARYYAASLPYCLFVLASPLLLLVILALERPSSAATLFLALNVVVIFGTTFLFSNFPILRYLQPLSYLCLMVVAATVSACLRLRESV